MTSVIGVDIGGTKTRLVRAGSRDAHDAPLDDVVVASSSWRGRLGEFEADAAGLRALLVDRFGADALGAPLAVGAHGCDNTAQCLELERALRRHVSGPVVVVNDSELMGPAMGLPGAVGVVVGTGSIATARTSAGELVTAGGWGWVLGDEGSAPALVRDATRAVLESLDRGAALDPLGRRLLRAFDARDGAQLAHTVGQATSSDAWGRHASEIFAAAEEGSHIAYGVIRDAGVELARLVDRILRRDIAADAVVAGGAVIEGQPRLQAAFGAALARRRPGLALKILDQPPVAGAIALARDLASHDHTHPTIQIGDPPT